MVGDLAAALELPLVSRDLTPDDLLAADEAMLTSTSICMLPIVRCDGVPIGNGRPGEVFGRLLTAWSAAVGIDIAQQAHRWAQEAKGS